MILLCTLNKKCNLLIQIQHEVTRQTVALMKIHHLLKSIKIMSLKNLLYNCLCVYIKTALRNLDNLQGFLRKKSRLRSHRAICVCPLSTFEPNDRF